MSVQRLIDANALKEQIDYYIKEEGWSEHDNRVLGWCKEFIDNAPTVKFSLLPADESKDEAYMRGYDHGKIEGIIKANARPQGEWYYSCDKGWECNQCHEIVKDMPTCMRKALYNFCPNCGADMRGDENGKS